ncbi:MAG TPA: DNA polymerase III subunit gamma/tau [Actinomycetota bacterium]|nr:DNA polymerase III subunit gamma/tau [Actinomycetota bacterium]
MAYLSLYRKYRSQTFEEILGQEHVTTTLGNAIRDGRVAHSYLFTGPRGTGKTSTARVLAKALNCEKGPTPTPCGVCDSCVAISEGSSLDVIEMDAASHSKVDDTREILAGVSLATAGGRTKIYVIDEVHMLSTASFNALLKTLEEPPPHVVFVLATTEAHAVLPTIVSRTQRFDFRRIPAEVLERHLGEIAKLENIDIEPDALALVARSSDGSARDALSTLDQLASFGGHVSVVDAETLLGRRSEDLLVDLFDAIAAADVGKVFSAIGTFVAQGTDMRQLALDCLEHARSLLLLKSAPDAEVLLDVPTEDRPGLLLQAEAFTPGHVVRILDLLGKAIVEMRNAPNHRLLLEVALVRSAAPETDPSANGLLGRIERLERRLGIESDNAPAASPPAQAPAPRSTPQRAPAPSPTPTETRPPSETPTPTAARPRKAAPASTPSARNDAVARAEPEDKAAPAPQPVAETAPPAPVGEIGLGHVRDAWHVTLQEVNKRSKRVGALLNPSRPVAFDETITVEVQSEFHRDTMSEGKNSSLLADALHAALGIRVPISFVARGHDSEPHVAPPVESLAEVEDTTATDSDDPIELVRQGLGGEVVEEVGREG